MGKIASDFADSIILTNDNPRFENPQKIRRDIKKGIKKKRIIEKKNYKPYFWGDNIPTKPICGKIFFL